MKYDFISIGGSTQDVSILTNQGIVINNKKDVLRQELLAFEYGAKIRVGDFLYNFGGGASNSAVVLSRLGFKTACLTSVGNDEIGSKIISNLKSQGIGVSLIRKDNKKQSGSSFIVVTPQGERVIFTHRGANHDLKINDKDLKKLKQTKNIYIASLSGAWMKSAKKIFSLNNIKIHWNPSEAQYSVGLKKLSPFLKKTHTLALNKDEAIELVLSDDKYKKATIKFLNNVHNLLRILKSYGPEIVVITSGKDGADVYDDQRFYHQDIIEEKKRVDSTGIGDCFNASFVAGLELYNNIDKALKLAARNAASKISYFGAQKGLIRLRRK